MITSADNPRVKEVLRLRKAASGARSGLFVAEGPREVGRARDGWARDPRDLLRARAARLARGRAGDERVLAKMAYRAEPRACSRSSRRRERELPPDAHALLVAVGVEKPGNLGAMARTAEAAGADALVVADGELPTLEPERDPRLDRRRLHAPVVEATLEEVARLAAADDRRGRSARRPATPTPTSPRPTAIVVGAEDDGLGARLARAPPTCRSRSRSHGARADSLNAATAAAILLFEAVRQRG